MTVVEREQVTTEQAPERAIFVASDGRRARRLRRATFVAAFLAALWVVGLGVGMLGFGSLPGVSFVKERVDQIAGDSGTRGAGRTKNVPPLARRSTADRAHQRPVESAVSSRALRSRSRASARSVPSRSTRPPARAVAPPPAAQTPVNPATRERGWARKGSTAPPGQARKVVPPPPPGTRGQRRGQDPTAPPPVPPGQLRKTEQTLPPPPPPPSKKA